MRTVLYRLLQSWPAWLAAVLGLAIVFIAGAGDLRLRHHDAFHYALMARWLADGNWRALGFTWPPGFPLLAAPLVRAGVEPAAALVAVNIAAFVGCMLAMDRLLTGCQLAPRARCIGLCALACLNPWVDVILDPMSEPPFILATLGVIFGVANLPQPRSILVSTITIAAAFLCRYVGAAYAVILPAVGLWRRRQLTRDQIVGLAAGTAGLLGLFWVLFAVNAEQSGLVLGDSERVRRDIDVAASLAALGQSVVRLAGIDWTYRMGRHVYAVRMWIGCLFVAVSLAAGIWACQRTSGVRRAAGLVSLVYLAGLFAATMVVFITGWIDARMTLPLLFPFVLIATPALRGRRLSRIATGLVVVFVAGEIVVAVHHGRQLRVSEAPVREAEAYLARRVLSSDVVALSPLGLAVARRMPAECRLVFSPPSLLGPNAARFLVVIEAPGIGFAGFEEVWRDLYSSRKLPGYDLVASGPHWLVFERRAQR